MKIKEVNKEQRKLRISIPLTRHTGKIRIKERKSYTDFGVPVATKQRPFNSNMYVEWQIGYDMEVNSKNINLCRLREKKELEFTSYNKKKKIPYELSEYLYYFYDMKIISEQALKELLAFLNKIHENKLIENIYKIYKSNPTKKEINGLTFLESEIKYPHLIYDFNNGFFIIAEITIKEKQKAIGIQPMLYWCFSVDYLKDEKNESLMGRTAKTNEEAIWELSADFAFIVMDTFKIFGMLSKNHRHDIIQIIMKILETSQAQP